MNTVKIFYYVIKGGCSAAPWIPWEVDLTDEEMAIYKNAIENEIDPNDVAELEAALDRAYQTILEYEEECAKDWGEEFDDEWILRVVYDY